jgi:hemoglobin
MQLQLPIVRRAALGLALGGALVLAACAPTQTSSASADTLYSRLGGQPAIEAVVDQFIANVAADNRINGRFANADIPRLNRLLVEQICEATGGPCKYTGADMRTAHAGMNLTDAEFNALVEDLVTALDQFEVPEQEKSELLGALGGMKPDIVGV